MKGGRRKEISTPIRAVFGRRQPIGKYGRVFERASILSKEKTDLSKHKRKADTRSFKSKDFTPLIAGAIVLVLLGAIAVCVILSRPGSGSDDEPEIEPMVISTDYGDLLYPEMWGDSLVTNQRQEGDGLAVEFTAKLDDGRSFELFQITIDTGVGEVVGEIADADGVKHTVYLVVKELETEADLTEEELNRLYAMQEDLNYLIDNLK